MSLDSSSHWTGGWAQASVRSDWNGFAAFKSRRLQLLFSMLSAHATRGETRGTGNIERTTVQLSGIKMLQWSSWSTQAVIGLPVNIVTTQVFSVRRYI